MKRTWVTCVMAAAVIGWVGAPRTAAAAVTACTGSCAEVKLLPQSLQAQPGQTVTVNLNFKQAENNNQPGGPDETAALALSIGMGSGTGAPPFRLADCTVGADGLPASVHRNNDAIPNFKVVVENAYCANGRTHCLCPEAGGPTPDSFINLVIYGPDPLPAPGPQQIDIPTLPAGPQNLVAIDLRAESGAGGDVQLHLYNQVQAQDATRPQYTALLSIGDKVAVDQTCVPQSGQPPCSVENVKSQVVTADSMVAVTPGCAGDCNGDNTITPQDLVEMVAVALGGTNGCPLGDDGKITVDEIVGAVDALGPCS